LNPAKPLRKGKVLDHLVFCGYYAKYEPWIPTNALSLSPRIKKLSTDFNKLEQMIIDSIKKIEKNKADAAIANENALNQYNAIPEAPSEIENLETVANEDN
jgi:hypothetical protein